MADRDKLLEEIQHNADILTERMRQMNDLRRMRVDTRRMRADEEEQGRIKSQTSGVRDTEGRVGLVDPSSRANIRRKVVKQDPLAQVAIESAPATAGAAIGAIAGSPFGGVGAIPGAIVGGTLGELMGQETGVSSESDVGLALSAGAPVAGAALGQGAKLVRRGVGSTFSNLPPVRAATAKLALQEGSGELTSLTGQILAKQKGLMRTPSKDLFTQLRSEGIEVSSEQFKNLQRTSSKLKGELEKFKNMDEVRPILESLNDLDSTLVKRSVKTVPGQQLKSTSRPVGGTTKVTRENVEFSFDEMARLRSILGERVGATSPSSEAGRSARAMFKSFSDDIDALEKTVEAASGAAKLKTAFKRARLEFATQDLDRAVAQYSRHIPGTEDVVVNVKSLRKWILDKTTPQSKKYDKNFVESIGQGNIKRLEKNLADLDKIVEAGKVGGPGSLVIQGLAAGTGGAIGAAAGAPIGLSSLTSGLGAMAATSSPKALTAALATPRGAKVLKRAAKLGRGRIHQKAWMTVSEFVAQSARSGLEQFGQEEQ